MWLLAYEAIPSISFYQFSLTGRTLTRRDFAPAIIFPELRNTLNKTPNFKQLKKRREDQQKKRNEEKQRQQAARKSSDPQPQKS